MNDHDHGATYQFAVSAELIQLLQWLIEHEQEALKKIINKGLSNGLKELILCPQSSDMSQHAHDSIIDFLSVLEGILVETTEESSFGKALENSLVPSLKHIDNSLCDSDTIALSASKASAAASSKPHQNTKEILCREIIRRWKPHKKTVTH